MTLAEVEAILGKPDRKLGRGDYLPSSYPRESESEQFFLWTGPINNRRIIVGFKDGKVCDWVYHEDSL